MCLVLDREVVAEKEGLLYGELMDGFWSPPLLPRTAGHNTCTINIIFS